MNEWWLELHDPRENFFAFHGGTSAFVASPGDREWVCKGFIAVLGRKDEDHALTTSFFRVEQRQASHRKEDARKARREMVQEHRFGIQDSP